MRYIFIETSFVRIRKFTIITDCRVNVLTDSISNILKTFNVSKIVIIIIIIEKLQRNIKNNVNFTGNTCHNNIMSIWALSFINAQSEFFNRKLKYVI